MNQQYQGNNQFQSSFIHVAYPLHGVGHVNECPRAIGLASSRSNETQRNTNGDTLQASCNWPCKPITWHLPLQQLLLTLLGPMRLAVCLGVAPNGILADVDIVPIGFAEILTKVLHGNKVAQTICNLSFTTQY